MLPGFTSASAEAAGRFCWANNPARITRSTRSAEKNVFFIDCDSPPRRGGVDAPSAATAQAGWSDRPQYYAELTTPAQQPLAVAPPLLSKEGNSSSVTGLFPNLARYAYDAIDDLKAARIRPTELRSAGAERLADMLEHYDRDLRKARLYNPHDRRTLAASRVRESDIPWLRRFRRVVLHALYDLTEAEFLLI